MRPFNGDSLRNLPSDEQNDLKFLDFRARNLTYIDLLKLLPNAADLAKVEYLDLRKNCLGDNGVTQLVTTWFSKPELCKLKWLHLGYNELTHASIKNLAEAFKNNTTLLILHLQCNNYGDEGAKALANMLATNRTLLGLHLNGDFTRRDGLITVKGVSRLMKALVPTPRNNGRPNTTLQQLNLWGHHLTDEAMEPIELLLAGNNSLQFLGLGRNLFTAAAGEYFQRGLQANSGLVSIDLRFNQLGDVGIEKMSNALATNTSLMCLVIQNNGITATGLDRLKTALTENKHSALCYLSLRTGDLKEYNNDTPISRGKVILEVAAQAWRESTYVKGSTARTVVWEYFWSGKRNEGDSIASWGFWWMMKENASVARLKQIVNRNFINYLRRQAVSYELLKKLRDKNELANFEPSILRNTLKSPHDVLLSLTVPDKTRQAEVVAALLEEHEAIKHALSECRSILYEDEEQIAEYKTDINELFALLEMADEAADTYKDKLNKIQREVTAYQLSLDKLTDRLMNLENPSLLISLESLQQEKKNLAKEVNEKSVQLREAHQYISRLKTEIKSLTKRENTAPAAANPAQSTPPTSVQILPRGGSFMTSPPLPIIHVPPEAHSSHSSLIITPAPPPSPKQS
jgi:hypothetical protein